MKANKIEVLDRSSDYKKIDKLFKEYSKKETSSKKDYKNENTKFNKTMQDLYDNDKGNIALNSIPKMVAFYGNNSLIFDLLDNNITLDKAKKIALGKDIKSLGTSSIVKSALLFGSNPNSKNAGIIAIGPGFMQDGVPSFHSAIKFDSLHTTKILANIKGKTDVPCRYGMYPIHYAFKNDMIKAKDKLSQRDSVNVNEFRKFCKLRIQDIVLKKTKNLDLRDKEGKTAMHFAVKNTWDDENIGLKMLIKRGAKLNIKDINGNTPLHMACRYADIKTITILSHSNASPNIQNKKGQTPLHIAYQSNRLDIAKKLIRIGADKSIKDYNGKIPSDYYKMEKANVKRPFKQKDYSFT